MAQGHHHPDEDTYFLDQLCLIAICAAFAGICLTMYFSNADMLRRILAEQFDPFVLFSGVALLLLVAVRAIALWREAGVRARAAAHAYPGHEHVHDHAGCQGHDHGHSHDHAHEHDQHVTAAAPHAAAAPGHAHSHEHTHDHGHDHAGHDHSWAPWRYVVLLVPIMLYLLGLPAQGRSARAMPVDLEDRAARWTYVVALGPAPLQQSVALALATLPWPETEAKIELNGQPAALPDLKPGMQVAIQFRSKTQGKPVKISAWDRDAPTRLDELGKVGEVTRVQPAQKLLTVLFRDTKEARTFDLDPARVYPMDFKALYLLAFDREQQREWEGKKVRAVGQLAPGLPNDPGFTLARFRIQCCGADAVQLSMPVRFDSGAVKDIKGHPRANDWVEVTGWVEFREVRGGGGAMTMLVVPGPDAIRATQPDPDPYIR